MDGLRQYRVFGQRGRRLFLIGVLFFLCHPGSCAVMNARRYLRTRYPNRDVPVPVDDADGRERGLEEERRQLEESGRRIEVGGRTNRKLAFVGSSPVMLLGLRKKGRWQVPSRPAPKVGGDVLKKEETSLSSLSPASSSPLPLPRSPAEAARGEWLRPTPGNEKLFSNLLSSAAEAYDNAASFLGCALVTHPLSKGYLERGSKARHNVHSSGVRRTLAVSSSVSMDSTGHQASAVTPYDLVGFMDVDLGRRM